MMSLLLLSISQGWQTDAAGSHVVTRTPLKQPLRPIGIQNAHIYKSTRNKSTVFCRHWLTLLPGAQFSNKHSTCFPSWKCKVSHKGSGISLSFLLGHKKSVLLVSLAADADRVTIKYRGQRR